MFSHVMIGTNDLEKAKVFYDALLGTLDIPPGRIDRHRIFYRSKTGTFAVTKPIDGKEAATPMAARSVLPPAPPNRPTRFMPPASPMAARPARTRRVSAKALG